MLVVFPRIDSTNADDVVALGRPETLVELLLAAREEFREMQQRCQSLASALQQAKQSLETLEAQSLKVQNAQVRELALLFSESESKTAELEHKSTRLELHNKRLHDEMAILAMSQRENEQLKQTVLSLRDKMARDQEEHKRDFEEVRESVVDKKQRLIRDYHDLLRNQGLQNSTHSAEDSRGEFVEADSDTRGALARADVAAKKEKKVMQMRDMVSRCEMFQTRYARLKQEAAIHEQIELERTRKLVRQGAELDRQKAETAKAFEDAESYRKENQLLREQLKQAMSCLEDNAQLKTLLADRDRHVAGLRDIIRQRVRPRGCKLPVTTSSTAKQGIVVEWSDMPLFRKDGEGIVDLDAETTAIWKATKNPFSDTRASHPLWPGELGPSEIYGGLGSHGRRPRQRRVGSSLSMREREAISPTLHFGDRGKQRSKTSAGFR